ncbi:MAG: hypothetical protein RJA76_124 [Bacteroidota bacterium]|jgi:hypothetical protein
MLVGKSLIYLFLTFLIILFTLKKETIQPALERKPLLSFWIIGFIFRLAPFLLIFIFAGFDARSDVVMFYDSAKHAMQGEIVYKEFESAYSPLFAYLTCLPLYIWDSPKAIILEMILIELGILWLSLRMFKVTIYWGLIYLCLPASFVLSVLGGQEDIWMWGMLAFSIWIFVKTKNEIVFGILLGLGFLVTKALFILLFPPFFFFIKKRLHFLAGLLLVGIPSFIILFTLMQWDFLLPVQQANDPRLPNIWTILHPISNGIIPLGPKWINWLGLGSLFFFGLWITYSFRKEKIETYAYSLFIGLYAWLMICQQSSVVNYAYAILLPLICYFHKNIGRRFLIYLCIFNLGVVLQAPLWWSMGMPYFHSLQDLANAKAFAEYFLEFCVMIPLIWVIWHTVFKKNKVILLDD